MRKASYHAVWPWLVVLAATPMPALAENAPGLELKLDIDQDGKTDRAVVIQEAGGPADLYIYLGEEKPDPAHQPDFVRKGLTEDPVIALESKGKGSLAVTSCFGCGASKSTEETLTIVNRHGKFLVGGYSRNWDWNKQTSGGVETTLGDCDINYLTGRATASKDLEEGKPIKGKFRPVPLKDWSSEMRPKACDF
ncbi:MULTISPECIES: hypothetical protein [unclassified Mesorhizobium]|uniref:hypothetical protein n=1 Tax=unclassified Mesorhizobium TaxID=325217 RepID=UPI00112A2FB1|nr:MULTISPECIES: hypothetical protein [unclassified Mesorhizobium]TPL02752.1 hypothetical protein FJ567_08110 [Mesorhizobium sp. B2-4-16]TPL71749.1 hypothetical protein FJ956_12720 [Mesorhizobium sp. B2-4-3]